MQSLTIVQSKITPFAIPFVRPFTFAGNTLTERTGFYFDIITADGLSARGEIAPLPGMNQETLKKARHDVEALQLRLLGSSYPLDKEDLIENLRKDEFIGGLCSSVRFGFESALFTLTARANSLNLSQFLGAMDVVLPSAVLLQGTHEEILNYAKTMCQAGRNVFKLKVGNRNVALDVKNVQDVRNIIGKDGSMRLDANRVWSFNEAILFAQLVGREQIEFIEEPLSDASRLNEFYQAAHLPIALDETLSVLRCGINAPGRCSPTLMASDGVKAFVIKPTVIGGVISALDWIEEARRLGKKAIVSSAFESPLGLSVLEALGSLSGQVPGLDTLRWLKYES